MKRLGKLFWPLVSTAAIVLSVYILYRDLRGLSLDAFMASLQAIPLSGWLLSCLATLVAYAALAAYDHLALEHLGHRISLWFITVTSFTTYALSHNIGGSVLSGAVIRYRAYGSRGLTGHEVGVLVAVCWITFVLSTLLVSGVVLMLEPHLFARFSDLGHESLSTGAGLAMIAIVVAYAFGSWLHLRPLRLGAFQLHYPRLPIVARQFLVGPVELLAAAGIVYFALPEAGNPGYLVVLGIFLVSFSVAQISHAPGGLGVFEVVFLAGLSDMDPARVVAALLAFRLLYLIIPLLLGLVVVVLFEHSQFGRRAD